MRLRLWVFEILGLTESRLTRETLNRHFHVLKDEALELVLKRLREAELLAWDASAQTYAVTPLAAARRHAGALHPGPAADGDLASLLAGVARAHQLGTLPASCSTCSRNWRGCMTSLPTRLPAVKRVRVAPRA